MSLISGISTASSYLSSNATQVTALSTVARIQAGEQPFSLDSKPAGAEEGKFVQEYQDRPLFQRELSTDTTGIMLSSQTKEFLASLPESQKLPIASMASSSISTTATQSSSQASILQSQIASTMPQTSAQAQMPTQRPLNHADINSTTYSPQARLVGGGASVEQTFLAGKESVQQRIYENDTDNSDNFNLAGQDSQEGTTNSEEFKIAGADTNQEDSSDSSNQEGTAKPENELTREEQEQVRELKARDTEVRVHEQAHVAAGGSLIRGGIQYEMQTGPDGRSYAIGGSVNIDTSIDDSSPEAMISKAQKIKAAALAPAEPSSADRSVAAAATQMEALGREAKRKETAEDMKQSLESMNAATSQETQSVELPEVEAVEIERPQARPAPTQDTPEIGEKTKAAQIQEQAASQNTSSAPINTNSVRTTDERRDIVRSTVIASSVSTSSLSNVNSASASSATLDAPPPKAPLPAEKPAPVSKGGSSRLNEDSEPVSSVSTSSVSSASISAATLDAPPPKAPLPAEKPAPVSKGGSSRLNSDAEPVSAPSASVSTSSELQMSPGQERFRSNAISAYQSIRTQAA